MIFSHRFDRAFGAVLFAIATFSAALPLEAQTSAASPAASLPASAAPIAIGACSYKTLNSGYGFGNVTLNVGHGNNFFTIQFTNNAAVSADQIQFQVDYSKSRVILPDAGTFAPGQTVTHTLRDHGKGFSATARPDNLNTVVCSVLSVHFTDGTTWNAPVALASPAAAASP